MGRKTNKSKGLIRLTDLPEYKAWIRMKLRCYGKNPNDILYYQKRKICVCSEWKTSFKAFYDYLGPRPSNKHSLDRINNEGNYEPGNVRWAIKVIQQRNRRKFLNSSSNYRGVYWDKRDKLWRAQIRVNKKQIYIGYFKSETEAAKAYNKKVIELFGDDTDRPKLNKI